MRWRGGWCIRASGCAPRANCSCSLRRVWLPPLRDGSTHFEAQLERFKASLTSLNPGAVLERGYSLTRNAHGEVVRDAVQVAVGERLTTTLAKGWLESEIRKKGG